MAAKPLSSETLQSCLDAVKRHGSIHAAARAMGVPRPTMQHRFLEARRRHLEPSSGAACKLDAPVFKRTLKRTTRRAVITAAQNATPVHAGFLRALEGYCNANNAELIVIPFSYKNQTSIWTKEQQETQWWDAKLVPYLCNERKNLNPNLVMVGDTKIQPTDKLPLSGLQSLTRGESAVFPHTRLHLQVVPVTQGAYPKIMSTTGAVTQENYTATKAGKIADFHHVYGAALVEINGKTFHLRQINAKKDGSFIEWGREYLPNGRSRTAPRAQVLHTGDTHVDSICPVVERATYGPDGIVEQLDPEWLVFNDLLDGETINPHSAGNWMCAIEKILKGRTDARGEVERACAFVERVTPAGSKALIVPSNHNDFLTRWLVNTDPRTNPANLEFWCDSAKMARHLIETKKAQAERIEIFAYWAERLLPKDGRFKVLRRDDSHMIGGVEQGLHGDCGPNGARGSLRNLSRIGVKANIDHSHTPGILDGTYQSGTSTPRHAGYTKGPSSWLNTHTVQYANGKRTLVTLIEGEFRLG